MGVPKFYRWISERYPCLSEVVKEFQLPEFDTLYLDMNGIIHVCSHPEDDNPHFRITEEKIFTDVSHYIEFLFRMIKPRRCFFMAIDGVAPRAKMNQQRGRRFRSAREAEELEKRAREKGEILPSEKRFDSNCITPGTPFMARLQDYLKYFVAQKISTDPLWQNVKVILSGHETPGEGEHKVMDYIRYQKASPNYDPNTRHCLYGLDADLMMLGLLTHEPHFCLLREEVRFAGKRDKNKRPATPEETTFHLLHLSLMREYLDFEFASLKEPGKLGFEYDLERVIDDWVLMGFLVGNDFIPHLPHLHIHHDGLPLLWKTYINVLPQLDGYLNDGGRLNLPRFEKFVTELAKYDTENFRDSFSDLKWLEGKVGKRKKSKKEKKQERRRPTLESGGGNQFEPLVNLADEEEEGELNPDPSKAEDTNGEGPSVGDLDDDDTFDSEFRMHKDNYYMTKMDYVCVTPEVLKEQATEYVRAIQWILLYYFEGVPSWSWFYPYHYAPYMSDLRDFADLVIEFDLSRPFLPFQQLMAVLPAASKEILPKPYQALMTEENSAIVDFYPVNFSTDLNGKLQEWEAVVLIPFIDEKRLLDAMEPINAVLTDEEKTRNRHGPHRLFEYSKDVAYEYTSPLPELFPDIILCKARCTQIPMFEFRIPSHQLYKGLPSGVRLDVYFPGFPTMKYLPHKAELKKAGVRVFQMNSRNDNMIVRIIHETEKLLTQNVAQDLLGNTIFVGWPHLIEAKVVEVSDGEVRCKLADSGGRGQTTARQQQVITERMSESEAAVWSRDAGGIKERLYEKRGMEIGRTAILIRVLPMMGRKYVCTSHGQVTLEKQWAVRPVAYALQNSVKDIAVHDASYTQFTNLEELFCPRTPVFMLGWPHYGCQGEVLDVDSKMEGRIRVSVTILQEPSLDRIQDKTQSLSMQYMAGYIVAQRVGINSHLLSRITGTIFVARGSPDTHNESDMKANIGLNLKFNKRNEEVPGFTKKVENQWLYSAKALEVVAEYVRKFPAVFEYISCQERGSGPDFYFEDDIFHSDGTGSLKAVADFLKTLPCSDVKPMKVGADIVDELVIREIEREVERIKAINKKKRKSVKMQVKPHLLFRPIFLHAGLVPDPHTTFQLFDRVVSVREGFSVPFGLRGTIIGIHQAETDTDTIYEVVFDAEFVGGITLRCSPGRGYRCSANAIINISHGERKEKSRQNPSGSTTSFTSQQGAVRSTSKGSNSSGSGSWGGRPENSYSSLKNSSSNSPSNRSFGNQNVNNRYGTQTSGSYSMLQTGNHGLGQRGYTQERPPGKSTEFADMWKELQGSTEAKSPRTNPAVSLSEAANALPQNSQKTAKNQINQRFADMERQQSDKKPEHPSPSQSTSMTKIDLQSLFGQASSVQQTEKSGNEFAAMLNSLEISAAQKSDGSVVFQRSPSTEAPKDVTRSLSVSEDSAVRTSPITPSSSQSYGRQLSVQELFAGAKQSSTAAPSQPTPVSAGISTSGKSGDDSHPTEPPPMSQSSVVTPPDKSSHPSREDGAPQQAPPLPVNPLLGLASLGIPPPGMTPPTAAAAVPPSAAARNPVMGLLEFAKSAGLPPPVYDYVTQQKGQIRAYVTLGTGQKFHGSVCRTREEAAESAASMTLRQMDKLSMNMMMMGGPRMQGPHNPGWGQQNPAWRPQNPAWRQRPNLHFSPNSAFSPVHTKQPMFTGVPFPPGSFSQPPPNFIGLPPGHFPPPRALGRGYDVNHPQGNIAKPSLPEQTMAGDRSSVNRESVAAGTSNPFVPLQVTMKQKSPQKPTSSSTRVSVEKGENSTSIAQPTAVPTRPESSSIEVERKPQTIKPNSDSLAQGVKKIPPQADAEKEKSKKQPKRTKSRLAANFNFPN